LPSTWTDESVTFLFCRFSLRWRCLAVPGEFQGSSLESCATNADVRQLRAGRRDGANSQGATLEFTWDGSHRHRRENGKKEVTDSSVQVDGKEDPPHVAGCPSPLGPRPSRDNCQGDGRRADPRDADKHIYRMVRVRK